MGLVPVFKFQEPRGSGVDEALVVWSLGGEQPLHSSTPASLVRRAMMLKELRNTTVDSTLVEMCSKTSPFEKIQHIDQSEYNFG